MEALEHRFAPAVIWVSRLADDQMPGTLRKAIAQANDGDTIQFTAGTAGTINLVQGSLGLSKNITISGPGISSILVGCNAQPVFRVFTVATGKTCEIDNLTVYNGGILNSGTLTLNNVEDTSSHAAKGGGIENYGTLTLTGCTISGCSATDAGGGIYNGYRVTCSNTNIWYNDCDSNGGGIYSTGSSASVSISNSTVAYNTCGNIGAGIYNYGGTLAMSDSSLINNAAQVDGGGLAVDGTTSQVTLTNVQVSDNAVWRDGGKGGGFFLAAGSLTLNSITLSGNTASVGAGGAWITGASLTISNPAQITDPIVEVSGF